MQTIILKYLFFVCCSIISIGYGQDLITKSVAEIAKLPDNDFYDVLQDSKGEYWFATDSGLYRFNGKEFVPYQALEQRNKSVFNLKEDNYGRIWCNNLSGQFFFIDPSKDQLELFVDAKDFLVGTLPKYELFKDRLMIKLDNGQIFQYDFHTKNRTILVNNVGIYSDIKCVGSKLFYRNYDLTFIDLETKEKHSYNEIFKYNYVKFYDLGGELYITCSGKENKIQRLYVVSDKILTELLLPDNFDLRVYELYKNNEGQLFFATDRGVKVVDRKNQRLQLRYGLLNGIKISKIIKDTFGNYIFTSLDRGVYYWDGEENYYYNTKNFDIANEDLQFVNQLNSKEFLVTDFSNNLYRIRHDKNSKVLWKQRFNSSIIKVITNNKPPSVILDDGSLYNLKDESFVQINTDKFSSIKDVEIHQKNRYIADSYRLGSIKINGKDSLKIYRHKRCHGVKVFKEVLYGAFSDGVYKLKKDSMIPMTCNRKILYADELLNGQKYLWAVAKNQGIYFGVEDTFKQLINSKNKNIILKRVHNVLYLLDEAKLFRINEESLTVNLLKNMSSYVKKLKVNDFDVVNDKCLLTTNKGLFQISLSNEGLKAPVAKTFVSKILINDIPVSNENLASLSYNQNSFKFYLQNTDFKGQNAYVFRYKIHDSSSDWQYIRDLNSPIYLSFLSSGKYSLIYQTLKDLKVIDQGVIRFTIPDPYWKTTWFLIVVIMGVIGVVFLMVNLYVGKLKAKQHSRLEQLDLEKNLAEAKLQNLTSQMNPHFTFNALNTVQGLILDNKKEDAYTYLAHFSNLFRKSIDFSSKTFNTLDEEICFLKTYLKIESKRFNDQLLYKIDDSALEDHSYKIPAMILQPFIENAIKHGLLHKKGSKQLSIEFAQQQNVISCSIVDNGIGRKASKILSQHHKNNHLNIATSSVQKRFDLYQRYHDMDMGYQYFDLTNFEGNSTGTKVIISMPIIK